MHSAQLFTLLSRRANVDVHAALTPRSRRCPRCAHAALTSMSTLRPRRARSPLAAVATALREKGAWIAGRVCIARRRRCGDVAVPWRCRGRWRCCVRLDGSARRARCRSVLCMGAGCTLVAAHDKRRMRRPSRECARGSRPALVHNDHARRNAHAHQLLEEQLARVRQPDLGDLVRPNPGPFPHPPAHADPVSPASPIMPRHAAAHPRTWELFRQARQRSTPVVRFASAMRPHRSHTWTRYSSEFSNKRS